MLWLSMPSNCLGMQTADARCMSALLLQVLARLWCTTGACQDAYACCMECHSAAQSSSRSEPLFPPYRLASVTGFREAAEAARQRLVAIAADNKDDPEVRIDLHFCPAVRLCAAAVHAACPRKLCLLGQTPMGCAMDDHRRPSALLQAFRRDLINIAKTTLSSKILTQGAAWFAVFPLLLTCCLRFACR